MRPVVFSKLAALAIACTWACSDDPARVRLLPVETPTECGSPDGATELRVIAYTGGGDVVRTVPLDGTLDIADFPADTEQLGVELVVGGGVVGAAGKTAPFDFGALEEGTTLRALMAPPGGLCQVGAMTTSRRAPLVARTGDGILIVGGVDAAGEPLASAERYDPATGTFTAVPVPALFADGGFIGTAITELPDGRVVLTGGPRPGLTIYDPVENAFSESVILDESRAFHGAVALGDRILLTGGCSGVAAGACQGVVRRTSRIYSIENPDDEPERAPTLVAGRLGARLIAVGVQRDGGETFVSAGGQPDAVAPDASAADRFVLGADDATAITGTFPAATLLDGGGVLTMASGEASVITPVTAAGGAPAVAAVAIGAAPAVVGITLATAEDGTVVGFGAGTGELVTYDPMRERWDTVEPAVGSDAVNIAADPTLIRLADGSILVLAPDGAAVYRPSLVGPGTGSTTVVPLAGSGASMLTPADASTLDRSADWVLSGGFAPAVVGGPRLASGSLRAVVRVRSGGAALVARYQSTGATLVAELLPEQGARIVQYQGALQTTLCTGTVVGLFDPAAATTLELVINGGTARVSRDGIALASCSVGAGERGAWGVASLGGDVAVDTVTVAR